MKSILLFLMLVLLKLSYPSKDKKDVSFIEKTPVIDGQLDADLFHLDIKRFKHIWQFDNPVTDTAQLSYRIAYTPSHLYLYIETNVDSISYHKRGYLWGDGYKILLGIPQADSLTNEYYELAYSPSEDKNHWERQKVFGYNFTQIRKYFSKSSMSQELASQGKSGFEALIAWSDIKPYHPWFLDEMGLNIYFAKGIESEQHGYITNGYALVEDEGIWDEEIPRRNYMPISFEEPNAVINQVLLVQAKKHNLQVGEAVAIEIASLDKEPSVSILNYIFSDSTSKIIVADKIAVKLGTVLKKETFDIDIGKLKPATYKLTILNFKDTILEESIVVKPIINFEEISDEIQENKNKLLLGTCNTLQFELNQIENKMTDLKVYEKGEVVLEDWNLLRKKYEVFLAGTDPYKDLRIPYRRAFCSKYDQSYQPYTINLPDDYDPNKKYPLLVFLHGSGSDEQAQGLLNRPRSGGNFIEIAPLARDIFRAYAMDESQKDIIEAIDDVSKYFSVDKDKIVIGGFSMGGFGALRTYYEHPELYKGVVVHAGHPNLANEWLDGEHPNFLEEKYLGNFTNMPVFIYHGEEDPAIDVNLIKNMSKKLSEVGAFVTESYVAKFGHQYPDELTNEMYFNWLDEVVGEEK